MAFFDADEFLELNNHNNIKDFLNNYLPQNIMNIIDIDTLEPQKDSFINEELKEEFSDLLFRVNINNKDGYLYFLFEHKSYISKDVPFQLLKYMIEIWEAKMKKEGRILFDSVSITLLKKKEKKQAI